MTKNTKILLAGLGVIVLIAVLLTMLGKLDLPLGPLKGALASDDAAVGTTTTPAGGAAVTGDCPTGSALDATGTATDPTTGAAVDPTATTPGADATATVPGTGAAAGTDTTTTTPGTGAAPGTGADGTATTGAASDEDPYYEGATRVVAAGSGRYSAGEVTDTPIYAADAATTATDPTTGLPTDPTATGTGADATTGTDPTTGAPVTTDTTATDPGTIGAATDCGTDPTAGATPTDPTTGAAIDPTTGAATDAGAGTGTATTPATGGAATPTTPATPAISSATDDGTNSGNSPEALRIAADAAGVMQQAKITVSVNATLLPGVGGSGAPKAVRLYRSRVTAAALVIKLTDPNAQQQWTSAGKKIQVQLVRSFLTRLRTNYPKSARSVSVVDSSGKLLAVGDAPSGRPTGAVKLF